MNIENLTPEEKMTKLIQAEYGTKEIINKNQSRPLTKIASFLLNIGMLMFAGSWIWFPYILGWHVYDTGELWGGIVTAFNTSSWMFIIGLAAMIIGGIFGGRSYL